MGTPRDAFSADLGTAQGRIIPTGWTAPDGTYVLQLGHDRAGVKGYFGAGDSLAVYQDFDGTGVRKITYRAKFRPPSTMPAGWSWRFVAAANFAIEYEDRPLTRPSESADGAVATELNQGGGGETIVLFALTLDGPTGEIAEVEIPGVWIDALSIDPGAPSVDLFSRNPCPGETAIPLDSAVRFTVSDMTGAHNAPGAALVNVWIDGTPAVVAGVFQVGFSGSILDGSLTDVFGAPWIYTIQPAAPFASLVTIPVRVTYPLDVPTLVVFTHDAFTDINIACPAHPFTGNEAVQLTTTGTLPLGLSTGTTYYIEVQDTDDVTLLDAPAPGGNEVFAASTGTGVHTLVWFPSGGSSIVMGESVWAFTTADTIAPVIVSAIAVDEWTVRVEFDEPVMMVDALHVDDALNPANYTLLVLDGLPAVTPVVASVAPASDRAVELRVDRIMTRGATYQLAAMNVADLFANAISAPDNVTTFVGYQWPVPAGRATGLFDMLPEDIRTGDASGDHRRLLAVLQELFDIYYGLADRIPQFIDPDFAPEPWVDLMLSDLGNPFDFLDLDEAEKRLLVQTLVAIYRTKGTAPGIVSAIRFFLGITVAIRVYAWAPYPIGQAVIGSTLILGSSDAADLFTFEVVVTQFLTDVERRNIAAIIEYMKVAHEHWRLIEPVEPVVIDHWQIGFSHLGSQSFLHAP